MREHTLRVRALRDFEQPVCRLEWLRTQLRWTCERLDAPHGNPARVSG